MTPQERLAQLQHLLKQSTAYSTIIKQRMDEEKEKQAAILAAKQEEGKKGAKRAPPTRTLPEGKRRKGADGEAVAIHDEASDVQLVFQQPSLITATLKPYQLEGLQWMVSLDQNGISGILGMCS